MAEATAHATRPSRFYLTGSFNSWRLGDPALQFHELLSRDVVHKNRPVETGSYTLECELPAGELWFKIVEGESWDYQWTVSPEGPHRDEPYDIASVGFRMRNGLRPCLIRRRGGGKLPHAVWQSEGGTHRLDLHPASSTLTIHRDVHRLAAPRLDFWRTFAFHDGFAFATWVCLPYGHDGVFAHPLCLMFDAPGRLYGEARVEPAPRQQWRYIEMLARHGVIAPPIIVGVGVPYAVTAEAKARVAAAFPDAPPAHRHGLLRHAAFLDKGGLGLRAAYARAIVSDLLPAAHAAFALDPSPDAHVLEGHSNGADIALFLLAEHADRFGGVAALSPATGPHFVARLRDRVPAARRRRLRVALAYAEHDLSPPFLLGTAGVRERLAGLGVPHLVQYMPGASHSPDSLGGALCATFGFALP